MGRAMQAKLRIDACHAPSEISTTLWHEFGASWPILDLGFDEAAMLETYVGLTFRRPLRHIKGGLPPAEELISALISDPSIRLALARFSLYFPRSACHAELICYLRESLRTLSLEGLSVAQLFVPVALLESLAQEADALFDTTSKTGTFMGIQIEADPEDPADDAFQFVLGRMDEDPESRSEDVLAAVAALAMPLPPI